MQVKTSLLFFGLCICSHMNAAGIPEVNDSGATSLVPSTVENSRQVDYRKNGVFINFGVLNFFITPSIGYLRFITDHVFLLSYFNYSYADVPDALNSYKNPTRKNIDSERTGYMFAIGPEIAFHKFDWADAKTLLFCGVQVGYYSFSVALKPGAGRGSEPPLSLTGADSWRGFAAGANIGAHITKSNGLFFMFAFGAMFGQTRDVDFKVVNKDGTIESGVYKNYPGNYSFTPQITIAVGFAF